MIAQEEIKTAATRELAKTKLVINKLADIREEVRNLAYTKPEKQIEKIEKIAEDLSILRDFIRDNKKQTLSDIVNALYLYVESPDIKEERAIDLVNSITKLGVINKILEQEL